MEENLSGTSVDGGYFIFDTQERTCLLSKEPAAEPILRKFVGSDELINGKDRWILTPSELAPQQLRALPETMKAIERVRQYRLGKLPPRLHLDKELKKPSNLRKKLAETPIEFHVTVLPQNEFLAIPEVSSERREYIPIAWLTPPTVPSNKLLVAEGVQLHQFALKTSKMHMAWTAFVGGRLKNDYQYSPGINFNPFPWPALAPTQESSLTQLAQNVLNARLEHPLATLADLYDPNTMPRSLRKAHLEIDAAVDRLFRGTPFGSDRERVEHLFALYEKATQPASNGGDVNRSKSCGPGGGKSNR